MKLPHHSLVRPVIALAFLLCCVSASTCPLNFSYVQRIHWNSSLCHNPTPSGNNTARDHCCRDVLAVFGIALARRLKEISLFMLPNLSTYISCFQLYQSKLTSLSFPRDIVSRCVDPVEVVITPNMCARIESTHDWAARLGEATVLNTACRPDPTNPPACDACVNSGFRAQGKLLFIDGNQNHTTAGFHFLVLYAAGIVNQLGPESHGSMSCIFGLSLMRQAGARDERRGQYMKRTIIIGVAIGTTLNSVLFIFPVLVDG